MIDLSKYGFNDRYRAYMGDFEGLAPARVVAQDRGMYSIVSEIGEQLAEVSGKFIHNALVPSDYPAVGDFVMVDCNDMKGNATIHAILPRKSVFTRKAAGKSLHEQIVAANIDTIFICMSLNNDFNVRRLERYISVAWDSGAMPVVVFTKSDLCDDVDDYLRQAGRATDMIDVVTTSSVVEDGVAAIAPYIRPGRTIALIGSSGVGKSTLINRLVGEKILETNGLRNDDKGRHTTTRRQLFLMNNGGLIIDTPGMRELGMWNSEAGIDKSFREIEELASECRFADCTHSGEPGCAVIKAIRDGRISQDRFDTYVKLKSENDYSENAQAYLEKKKEKFKKISKINKHSKKY